MEYKYLYAAYGLMSGCICILHKHQAQGWGREMKQNILSFYKNQILIEPILI